MMHLLCRPSDASTRKQFKLVHEKLSGTKNHQKHINGLDQFHLALSILVVVVVAEMNTI